VLEPFEHDMHPAGVFGSTSVPQVLPPPPLLPVPLLLVPPPLLPLLLPPPLLLPLPHTPPRGTQALTCAPALVLSVVHASAAPHVAPPAHDAAQYVSPATCTQ
jgi:hypothetical protein